jgi:hypothetical protein
MSGEIAAFEAEVKEYKLQVCLDPYPVIVSLGTNTYLNSSRQFNLVSKQIRTVQSFRN